MTYTSVQILCTDIESYRRCMKLLIEAGYRDVAGTPEDYAKRILDVDEILVIAAFSDMTAVVGTSHPTKARRRINGDTFILREVMHSKDVSLACIKGFWKHTKRNK